MPIRIVFGWHSAPPNHSIIERIDSFTAAGSTDIAIWHIPIGIRQAAFANTHCCQLNRARKFQFTRLAFLVNVTVISDSAQFVIGGNFRIASYFLKNSAIHFLPSLHWYWHDIEHESIRHGNLFCFDDRVAVLAFALPLAHFALKARVGHPPIESPALWA